MKIIVQIPDINRAKADLHNIAGVIFYQDDKGFHKIETEYGMLEKSYCTYVPKYCLTVLSYNYIAIG